MSDKTLKSIPTGKLSRTMRLARLTASVGTQAFADKVAGLFESAEEKASSKLVSQIKQAQKIADALSQMKGAAMKLGQILSIHGEDLFPKEVVAVLARLQQHSDSMEFAQIEKVLIKELGANYGSKLVDVSREPVASASIGQVHRGVHKPSGLPVAVKVQYPGVDTSIDSDIDSLASLLSMLTRFPMAGSFNRVTDEIKALLRHETDYLEEGKSIEFFRKHFSDDERIVIPEYIAEISSKRVLSTEFVDGLSVQKFAETTASAAARASLGEKFLEVFYRELFELGQVQTDPNFANYKIRWSFGVSEPGLVLLDFGAVKIFPEDFMANYKAFIRCCLKNDYEGIRELAVKMGFLREDDPKELVDLHYELIMMFMEPFQEDKPYIWHKSDLAERIRKFIPKFIFAFKLRPPPHDLVFLDRKIAGVYFFCSAIRAEFNPRPLLERFAQTETRPAKG